MDKPSIFVENGEIKIKGTLNEITELLTDVMIELGNASENEPVEVAINITNKVNQKTKAGARLIVLKQG